MDDAFADDAVNKRAMEEIDRTTLIHGILYDGSTTGESPYVIEKKETAPQSTRTKRGTGTIRVRLIILWGTFAINFVIRSDPHNRLLEFYQKEK